MKEGGALPGSSDAVYHVMGSASCCYSRLAPRQHESWQPLRRAGHAHHPSHPDDATPAQRVQGGMDGGSSKKGSTTPRAPSVRRSRVPGTDPGTSENASQAEAKFLEPACPRGSGGAAGGVSGVEPGGCRLFQLAGWPRECLSDTDCDKAGARRKRIAVWRKEQWLFCFFASGFVSCSCCYCQGEATYSDVQGVL